MFIDEFEAGWLDELDSWADELRDGRQLYLLIDGVFVPGLQRRFISALGDHAVSLLFETLPACSEAVKDASPFVLRYPQGQQVMKDLLRNCSGWPMVSVLETAETLGQLVARLAAWCVVENDGQRFNFRFPDTRRLPGIFGALTPRQQGEFAGPAVRWNYIGRQGIWQSLTLPGVAHAIQERPQKLDNEQFGRMVSDSEADEMIVQLDYRGQRLEGKRSQAYATVAQALAMANARELANADRFKWVVDLVRRGKQMDKIEAPDARDEWRVVAK
ncbi:DUF4123 domain-containing protein [Pseudoduganella sp. LjRoot289]|uniref:DUF4123 domain-containing protein n=1 Tax=Pseudoduganella sp. LjRoot289 TaxID=3342314 RepID=UPI003ECD52D4